MPPSPQREDSPPLPKLAWRFRDGLWPPGMGRKLGVCCMLGGECRCRQRLTMLVVGSRGMVRLEWWRVVEGEGVLTKMLGCEESSW